VQEFCRRATGDGAGCRAAGKAGPSAGPIAATDIEKIVELALRGAAASGVAAAGTG
jgi:hypothetical protein